MTRYGLDMTRYGSIWLDMARYGLEMNSKLTRYDSILYDFDMTRFIRINHIFRKITTFSWPIYIKPAAFKFVVQTKLDFGLNKIFE